MMNYEGHPDARCLLLSEDGEPFGIVDRGPIEKREDRSRRVIAGAEAMEACRKLVEWHDDAISQAAFRGEVRSYEPEFRACVEQARAAIICAEAQMQQT